MNFADVEESPQAEPSPASLHGSPELRASYLSTAARFLKSEPAATASGASGCAAVCAHLFGTACYVAALQVAGHLSRGTLVQHFTSVLAVIMRLRQVGRGGLCKTCVNGLCAMQGIQCSSRMLCLQCTCL
jgi:hypothetical protein